MADAAAAFVWAEANPGPIRTGFPGGSGAWQDLSDPAAYEAYAGMLARSPIPAFPKALWVGSPVWFMYEQIFFKAGTVNHSPWHQGKSHQPVSGEQLAVVWSSLDPVSHRGPLFNRSSFKPDDPTDPIYKTGSLLRLPDIEAERNRWAVASRVTSSSSIPACTMAAVRRMAFWRCIVPASPLGVPDEQGEVRWPAAPWAQPSRSSGLFVQIPAIRWSRG